MRAHMSSHRPVSPCHLCTGDEENNRPRVQVKYCTPASGSWGVVRPLLFSYCLPKQKGTISTLTNISLQYSNHTRMIKQFKCVTSIFHKNNRRAVFSTYDRNACWVITWQQHKCCILVRCLSVSKRHDWSSFKRVLWLHRGFAVHIHNSPSNGYKRENMTYTSTFTYKCLIDVYIL